MKPSRTGVFVGMLMVAPLTACGSAASPAAPTPTALTARYVAEPDLPRFTSPHAGDVQIPAALLKADAHSQVSGGSSGSGSTVKVASPPPVVPKPGPAGPAGPAGAAGAPGAAGAAGFSDAYSTVTPSVGYFATRECFTDKGWQGTGFVVAPDLVLTDYHVLQGMASTWTFTLQGKQLVGTTVGVSPEQDVALVRLSVPVTAPPLVLLASFPRVGTPVAAIGYALGLGLETDAPSMATGVVSGINRTYGRQTGLLQADMNTNHGASGGPVVATDGTVVGMVDAGIGDPQNIVLAIGSETAAALVAQWKKTPAPPVAVC